MVAASHRERALPLLVLAGACAAAFCVLYLIFVRTGHGQRIDEAAFQGRGVADEGQPAANRLLNTISIASLVIATVVLVGSGADPASRRPLARRRRRDRGLGDQRRAAQGVPLPARPLRGPVADRELPQRSYRDRLQRRGRGDPRRAGAASQLGGARCCPLRVRDRDRHGRRRLAPAERRGGVAALGHGVGRRGRRALRSGRRRGAPPADPPTGEWPRPAVSRRYLLAGAALLGAGYLGAIAIAFARQAGAIEWTLGNAAFFASCAAILALAAVLVAALLAALRVGSRGLGEPAVVPR